LKPFSGVALAWNVAVPPVEGMLIDCWEAVRVKSGAPGGTVVLQVPPVPVNVTDCGEFCARPETVRVAVELEFAVGAKVT